MKRSLYLLFAPLFLAGCSHDDALEGPELIDIFGEFEVVTPLTQDRTTVDFSQGETVEFMALFTVRTPWQLRIEGLTSGAVKIIESNEKDVSGAVARWNGSITFAPTFAAGERCVATMTFTDQPDTLRSDTILITGARPLPTGGTLISDFEDENQDLDAFSEGQFEETDLGISDAFPAAIGDKFFYMRGRDNNGSFFVSGVGISAMAAQNTQYYPLTTQNASSVYFNAFIYGEGLANTQAVIEFQEDDNLDGTYTPAQEGTYRTTITVDWVGWKLVSFRMDELELSPNAGLGNIDANGRQEIDRIINIQLVLISIGAQSAEPVGFGTDYAIFTVGQPFEP
ncbi:MAG: hypothetical protein AAGB22_14410 [Bacteroidota bacterium]